MFVELIGCTSDIDLNSESQQILSVAEELIINDYNGERVGIFTEI